MFKFPFGVDDSTVSSLQIIKLVFQEYILHDIK